MTKTLTEQWREGTLPEGLYYVKDWDGTINWFWAQNNILWRDSNNPIYASERIAVLSAVPSYDKLERLQEQINEANEVIKHYANKENWCNYYTEDDEVMKDSLYCDCDGPLKASLYLEKYNIS